MVQHLAQVISPKLLHLLYTFVIQPPYCTASYGIVCDTPGVVLCLSFCTVLLCPTHQYIRLAPPAASVTTSMHADPEGPGGESDQWLVFEVTDTGCGISQHGLGSLFTEYVQVGAAAHIPKPAQLSRVDLLVSTLPGVCCFCLEMLLLSRFTSCCAYGSCLTRPVVSVVTPPVLHSCKLCSSGHAGLFLVQRPSYAGTTVFNRVGSRHQLQTTRHYMSLSDMMRWCMHSQLSLVKSAFLQSLCESQIQYLAPQHISKKRPQPDLLI